jgi:hypothetical protein
MESRGDLIFKALGPLVILPDKLWAIDSNIAGVLGSPNTPDGNQTLRKSHFN